MIKNKNLSFEEEGDKMLSLPVVVKFDISDNKKRFLQEIEKGVLDSDKIYKRFKNKKLFFY